MSRWLRLESYFISIKHSFRWHLILISNALWFCSVFLKILLFRSSQICQQITFGRTDHATLIIWFLGGGPGYLFAHLENRSTVEQGSKMLGSRLWMKVDQICIENLHSSIKWTSLSAFSLHNEHLEGPWNPFFCRMSYVRIFPWYRSQAKKSTLGHEGKRQTPCQGAGSGGTKGLSHSLAYPMETAYPLIFSP